MFSPPLTLRAREEGKSFEGEGKTPTVTLYTANAAIMAVWMQKLRSASRDAF